MSPNALNSTYLGNMTLNEMSSSPFNIVFYDFTLNAAHAVNGLPNVIATLGGEPTDKVPYFMIDFSNDKTVVWSSDCNQTVVGVEESCFDAPTYLANSYTNTTNPIANFTG